MRLSSAGVSGPAGDTGLPHSSVRVDQKQEDGPRKGGSSGPRAQRDWLFLPLFGPLTSQPQPLQLINGDNNSSATPISISDLLRASKYKKPYYSIRPYGKQSLIPHDNYTTSKHR